MLTPGQTARDYTAASAKNEAAICSTRPESTPFHWQKLTMTWRFVKGPQICQTKTRPPQLT